MRKEKIDEIASAASDLSSAANELLEYFNSSTKNGDIRFNVEKHIHGTDVSFADCLSRILGVDEVAGKFEKSSHHLMVPLQRITQLKQSIDVTQQKLEALSNQFKMHVQNGGGQQSFNYENFHLQNKQGKNSDLRAPFKNFADATENLLEAFYRVLLILRPTKATYSFQAAANALSKLIEDTSEELQKLKKEKANLQRSASDAEAVLDSTKASADEAGRLKDESAKERRTISEYLADVTEKKSSIDLVHSSTSSLENEINAYKDKFEAFDHQLTARNESYEKGEENLADLFEKLEAQQKSVQETIKQSEGMLKGATVAGLASSFSEAHEKLGTQLLWARISFYIGILFLFVSAIPLMIYVFLPILAPLLKSQFPELVDISNSYFSEEEVSGWQYLGQVLARFIILLPAAWFVSFSAIRHSSLFRLREHYAYKYSMAVSVEGFRKQAQGYESEIAALVLEQLAFNPADKLIPAKEIKEGKVPHPMLDIFLNKFRSSLNKEDK